VGTAGHHLLYAPLHATLAQPSHPCVRTHLCVCVCVWVLTAICYPTKDLEVHLVAYLNFYLGWNEENVRTHESIQIRGEAARSGT
jgi:hypothetical protein